MLDRGVLGVRNDFRRMICGALLLGGGAAPLRAQDPTPPWHTSAAALRAVFQKPPDVDFCLVRLPAADDEGRPLGGVAAFAPKGARAVRVVAVDSNAVDLLVDCTRLRDQTTLAVYGLTNGAALTPDFASPDPTPLGVVIYRAGTQEAPPGWEEMRFLANRPARPRSDFLVAGFGAIASEEPHRWYQENWRRSIYLARLQSQLLVRRGGRYRLAVRSANACYLLLDGTLAVSLPDGNRTGWQLGTPLDLAPGLHSLRLFATCERRLDLQVGWVAPDAATPEPLPTDALVTAAAAPPARLERLSTVLHAAAVATLEPSYRFQHVPAQFTPVNLRSLHAVWEGAESVDCSWSGPDGFRGTGATLRVIATAIGRLPFQCHLRNALGMRAAATFRVDIDDRAASEYLVAGRLHGVPGICYDDDPVQPEIQLRGTAPDTLPLEVQALLLRPDGSSMTITQTLSMKQGWARLALPAGPARDFAALRWTLLHAGVPLDAGTLRFVRPPFTQAPSDLDGDTLLIDGEPCTLVPRRASLVRPPTGGAERETPRHLVMLDGFLALPGEAAGGAFDRQLLSDLNGFGGLTPAPAVTPLHFRRVALDALGTPLAGRGLLRLAPLARLPLLQPADRLVITPDGAAIGAGDAPGDFERRLAALSGLAAEVFHTRVLLVTPPAGGGTPDTPSNTAADDRLRPYAEAVVRVADAYGLSVADLYTACRTSGAPLATADDGQLTAAGRRLAAEVIARALVADTPHGEASTAATPP